jgi:hypothetical protein
MAHYRMRTLSFFGLKTSQNCRKNYAVAHLPRKTSPAISEISGEQIPNPLESQTNSHLKPEILPKPANTNHIDTPTKIEHDRVA